MRYQNCVDVSSPALTPRHLNGAGLVVIFNSPPFTVFGFPCLKALVAELQPRPVDNPSLVGMEAPYGLAFSPIGSHWLTKRGGLDLSVGFTQGIF